MFLNFLAINEKIINLNAVILVEDLSEKDQPIAKIISVAEDEIILEGDDAEMLFERLDLLTRATDETIARLMPQAQNVGS